VMNVKTKYRNVAISLSITLSLFLAASFQIPFSLNARAQQNSRQPVSLKVNTKNVGGAYELTAETLLYGDLKVYLPDDMAAGDTISGTVVAEPKGNTEEERARNKDTLEGYVVEIGDQKVSASKGMFMWSVPASAPQMKPKYSLRIIEVSAGKELASAQLPVITSLPKTTPTQTQTPSDYHLPTIGQQGHPVEITGPFDGNLSNTTLNWTAVRGENAENVSGSFEILAESPRKCVVMSPHNFAGPVDVSLKERNVEAKGAFRNVGVRLSAPKTNLTKGESTTLTVQIEGLQRIQEPVSLHLVKSGVVNMEGGDVQTILIPPADVQLDGGFTIKRTITGQQSGAFSVTATVVVFDLCLRDDNNGNSLNFSTDTGHYIFCQVKPIQSDQPVTSTSETSSLNGGSIIQAGDIDVGDLIRTGCLITLKQNTPEGRIQAQFDRCTQTGSATVQPASGKRNYTITDRDVRYTTCACK